MTTKELAVGSMVEKSAIEQTGAKLRYSPTEKINVIIVDNFPDLGKLAAFRFLEWAQNNEYVKKAVRKRKPAVALS